MTSDEVQPRPRDNVLIDLLVNRDGQLTTLQLSDGRRARTFNIAWRYAARDEYAQITTNTSPAVEGESSEVFGSHDVAIVLDADNVVLLDLRDGKPFTVEVQRDELIVIINVLNEVLHGPNAIEEWEFETRTGGTRRQARELLQRLVDLDDDRAATLTRG